MWQKLEMYRLKKFIVLKVEETLKNTPKHMRIKLLKTNNERKKKCKIAKIVREKAKRGQRKTADITGCYKSQVTIEQYH